jgi:class 3 adenylate cyclase
VTGILFADVVGSSLSKDDRQIVEVQKYLQEFVNNVSEETCLYKNTWGDGVVLACADPNDALEHALKLRAWFKNKNWRRAGFSQPLEVRIGLHAERVHLEQKAGKVSGIAGKQIVLTARIEPIVPSGRIYCTETFYLLVKDEVQGFTMFKDLGNQQLAKSFAISRLYEVLDQKEDLVSKEPTEQPAFGVALPKVKKDFSDSEKDDFLEYGYRHIRDYFIKASKVLQDSDKDLEVKIKLTSDTKLTVEVFVKGKSRARCQVWMSKGIFGNGIHYSQTISEADNSFNESLSVDSDGYKLSFRGTGMLTMASSKSLTVQEASELYWQGLIKQLQ